MTHEIVQHDLFNVSTLVFALGICVKRLGNMHTTRCFSTLDLLLAGAEEDLAAISASESEASSWLLATASIFLLATGETLEDIPSIADGKTS